uniref:Insulin related peptide 3 neuropeptide n=1 Tax=Platynereis dumerilii TaxID=6359 RepID=V5TCC3_PLADU|nr:insulin related peptide 3 neuropeptide precursor [Platynereis dumerilii]
MGTAHRFSWHLLLCLFATSSHGGLTRTCLGDTLDKRGLCGPGLSSALQIVCPNGYHYGKRSAGTEISPQVSAESPFLDKRLAMSILHNRGKRGIICECCKHKCSFSELKEYCHVPVKRSFLSTDTPKLSQDQMNLIDVKWGLDDEGATSRLVNIGDIEDDSDVNNKYLPSELTQDERNTRKDSQIGQLVRLLLDKSSAHDTI